MYSLDLVATLHPRMKQDVYSMNAEALQPVDDIPASCVALIRQPHGSICTMNRLPPELLGHIFKHVLATPHVQETPTRDAFTAFQIWRPTILDTTSSLVLSHVCRYWREVCLQSPTMWSHAVDSQSIPRDVLLELSRGLPLKILTISPESRWLPALSEQSKRIQELHWIQVDIDHSRSCLSFPAPSLLTVTLTGPRAPTSYQTLDSPLEDNFPVLFSDQTPSLAHLSLSSLPWLPRNRFDNLTCLYIDSCHGHNLLFRLLSLLGGCPRLENLIISALPDFASAHSINGTVTLGALRTLVLKQLGADDIALLLRYLALPTSTAVRLTDIFPCAASLPEALAVLPPAGAATKLAIDLTAAEPCVYAVGDQSGVRVDEYTSWFHYEFWLATASMLVSRAQIKELWLRASAPIDGKHGAALHNLIKALPELELLVVDESVVQLLGNMRGSVAFPTCPSLASVHVHCEGRAEARAIVDALLANRTQIGCKRVVVYCMPDFTFVREDWAELEACFRSLEYQRCRNTPEMAMPEVCCAPGHMLWPSWRGRE
ncbi:uncharacterized protein C8Q71DRAFT_758785 [Rhodofomes roseus]|uniref:F-box domain-containing protein n=1 Tax=Rhodofomes roseus TaxID=34475 RepID=A0ABQ8KG17_9APHY|nr:uncharacterized protein C8Q71DRAFT_758785 [Rhodofomes roseus]KAH9836616.1 hypothetical protein C8Q71DRAFT_758785 [Rhodofomes roseus]